MEASRSSETAPHPRARGPARFWPGEPFRRDVPLESAVRIVEALADRGYNADPEAVTLLAGAADTERAVEVAVEAAGDALVVTTDHAEAAIDEVGRRPAGREAGAGKSDAPRDAEGGDTSPSDGDDIPPSDTDDPSVSTGGTPALGERSGGRAPVETEGSAEPDTTSPSGDSRSRERGDGSAGAGVEDGASGPAPGDSAPANDTPAGAEAGNAPSAIEVANDVTGRSTGTGEYGDFVDVFRDRYKRLSSLLRSRVNHRPASAIHELPGGSDAAMVGMVNDVRSTSGGHRLVELEDTSGTFPCLVLSDREFAADVERLLLDEVVAVEGSLADDGGVLFVDALHFPDVPRTHEPATADREVSAALVSDVHVGSQEFLADAWERFADWLHTDEAEAVEYLLIAGDMVEGVGVYPDQDDELSIIDIYDQYEQFAEHLKSVPGDLEVVMIPGNHDAVRLAEPQPGFDEELRSIMSAHDARIVGNPATVTIEGVSVLLYHGVSLDEVIAELPAEDASYDAPHEAMAQLLRKRHLAPQFGGQTRLAPEERDYMVVEEVPDVFHAGHVHKLGVGRYHGVTVVNSGCWQAQTDFQRSVNIDPDAGFAPILELDTLDVTVRKFA